jgi:Cytochrome c554 and c-prime
MRWIVLLLFAAAAPALASDLAGPSSCRACHEEAYRIWSQSAHARAADSLPAEQRKMPLCLSCHSRDEQRSNRADPVASVSCETCHGGGRFYQPAEVMRDRELAKLFGLQDAQASCLSCHGSGSASAQPFDLAGAMKRIDHWSKDRSARAEPSRRAATPKQVAAREQGNSR